MNFSLNLYMAQTLITLLLFAVMFLMGRHLRDKKSKKRILELENEMLASHGEILSLQKEISGLRYTDTDPEQHRLYAVDKKKEA
jgi:hypothetical protein